MIPKIPECPLLRQVSMVLKVPNALLLQRTQPNFEPQLQRMAVTGLNAQKNPRERYDPMVQKD